MFAAPVPVAVLLVVAVPPTKEGRLRRPSIGVFAVMMSCSGENTVTGAKDSSIAMGMAEPVTTKRSSFWAGSSAAEALAGADWPKAAWLPRRRSAASLMASGWTGVPRFPGEGVLWMRHGLLGFGKQTGRTSGRLRFFR